MTRTIFFLEEVDEWQRYSVAPNSLLIDMDSVLTVQGETWMVIVQHV